jgi:NAD(P)-dependent dehydrogenase (short-subunit alcohol dehydrogenase family)
MSEHAVLFSPDTFAGKIAIVTGGGTGLGRAMALRFSGLGASVVIASRKAEHFEPAVAEIEQLGGHALGVQVDVRVPDQVDAMLARTLDRFGGVDILVNNAAGNFICRAEDLSPNGWRAVVGIVLDGTFLCSRAVGRWWIAQGRGGAMVNIVTNYAWSGGPGVVHSAAAKAGAVALTQTLAAEWGPRGIRTNALAPGPIKDTGAVTALHFDTPEAQVETASRVPLGRMGEPIEIADAVAFLASPFAAYVNGAVLTVDGGQWLGKGSNFLRLLEMAHG